MTQFTCLFRCHTVSQARGQLVAAPSGIKRPWKSEQPGNIPALLPFRAARFKFSRRPPTLLWQRSADKRLRAQTGRSVQLQDASVGGPEEGCRALFIQRRCRGSAETGRRPRNDVSVERVVVFKQQKKKRSLGNGACFYS